MNNIDKTIKKLNTALVLLDAFGDGHEFTMHDYEERGRKRERQRCICCVSSLILRRFISAFLFAALVVLMRVGILLNGTL